MKSNNKLNTALKDALYEHHEPLHDGQWERLRAELEEKKKRRFLPWFILFFGVALGAGLIGMYMESKNCTIAATVRNASDQTNSHTSVPSQNNTQAEASKETLAETEPSVDNDFNTVKGANGSDIPLIQLEDVSYFTFGDRMKIRKAIEMPQMDKADNLNPIENQSAQEGKTEENKPETVTSDNSAANLTNKDTTVKKTNKDDDTTKKNEKVRFIIGGSAGIAGVRSEIKGLSNEERLHKDSKNVFKMSNENQSAMFVNLNFEFKLSQRVGLRFNTGLHYKRINNQVNFTYKLREIPIRLPDNTILSYITVPDSSNPLIINVRESQTYSFLSLPLLVNYSLPINKNSELLMGAGVNLSALVGSTGSSFSLNELSYKQAGDMIQNPFNIGLNANLGYSRRLYGKWWLSAEAGLQTMNMRYDLGSGELRSRMISQSLALNLRYKITK